MTHPKPAPAPITNSGTQRCIAWRALPVCSVSCTRKCKYIGYGPWAHGLRHTSAAKASPRMIVPSARQGLPEQVAQRNGCRRIPIPAGMVWQRLSLPGTDGPGLARSRSTARGPRSICLGNPKGSARCKGAGRMQHPSVPTLQGNSYLPRLTLCGSPRFQASPLFGWQGC